MLELSEFRIENFEKLCKAIADSSYRTFSVESYLQNKPKGNFIILRHDVDYSIQSAIQLAQIESRYKLNATYYLKLNRETTAERIQSLRHLSSEIGLHYDSLAHCMGVMQKAREHFINQLKYLNKVYPVRTVSAHGSSVSTYNNNDFFKALDSHDYGIRGDAMSSVDFSQLYYYTDAGRSWQLFNKNFNDIPAHLPDDYQMVSHLDDLIDLIKGHQLNALYLSSHPELWAKNTPHSLFLELKYGYPRYLAKKVVRKIKSIS